MSLQKIDWPSALQPHIKYGAKLAPYSWFKVGGPAELLFIPQSEDDLSLFLKTLPEDVPLTVLGNGSNLLVRDGGVQGAVVRLSDAFGKIQIDGTCISAGAAARDAAVAKAAADANLSGLEFFIGVPGSIGGAVFMNAGCYGRETKDALTTATLITRNGEKRVLQKEDLGLSYRHSALPRDCVVIAATFEGVPDTSDNVRARMDKITADRKASQPLGSRTGGSTFANPPGHKAWQLIDAAGCRGLTVGGAQMSELHCNFMINCGNAMAKDLENLGETVRERVYATSGITLEWEIQRIGIS